MDNSIRFPKWKLWLKVALFSVLMSVPFLVKGLGELSLIGFIPLFQLDRMLRDGKVKHAFWYYYCAFLIFNVATTFWIWFVSGPGAIAAIILNALQMAAVFAIFRAGSRTIRRRVARPEAADALSLLFFTVTWLAWEHVYFNIEISWPWLCLGNAFATSVKLVQWYEIFGAVGGSAWILLCNSALYLVTTAKTRAWRRSMACASAVLVLVPIICSEIRYYSYTESDDSAEVVVIQPNVDPFHKYGVEPQSGLDRSLIEQMTAAITPDTRYIVTPETFTYDINIDQPEDNTSIRRYKAFLSAHPDTKLLLGALTYRNYHAGAAPTRSARNRGGGVWTDLFNTALVMDGTQVYGHYFKSKLVPGVEIIPYGHILKFLGPIIAKFGGSSTSYGTQDEMDAIPLGDGGKTGVMICYESVYGDWSRVATLTGAGFLTVMTNDGWWGDTPGYHQHFNFARLRAIENRRDVVQAANTGTSGFINQRGDVLGTTGWWVETTLKGTVNRNDALTPFVRHGDVTGRVACWLFLAMLLTLTVSAVSGRRSSRGRSAGDKS